MNSEYENNTKYKSSIEGIMKSACINVKERLNSNQLRVISVGPESTALLCRMKDPSKISRGDMLQYLEATPYWPAIR